ncbi:MAG: hypothetical protein AMXMBFR64_58300 [Myxococcales bacterium]
MRGWAVSWGRSVLLLGAWLAACQRHAPEPVEEPPPPVPVVAPAAPAKEDRFRSTYVAESAITTDPALLELIRSLVRSDGGEAVYEAVRSRKDALPALRRAIWHREPNVRTNAARILVKLDDHDPETADALVDVLLHDADADVRANIARALVPYKDSGVTDALILALETDPDGAVREHAAWALGAVGDKKSIDALVASLDDAETRVRLRSVSALRRLKARDAIPALVERVRDSNVVVRERTVQTLRELTGKKIGESYDLWKRATTKAR